MNSNNTHLKKLHSLVGEFKHASGDEVIGKMIPEFAELVVTLSVELDAAQRAMVRLTRAATFFALAMLVIAAVQLYVSMSVPDCSKNPARAEHLPSSPTPAHKQEPIKKGNVKGG